MSFWKSIFGSDKNDQTPKPRLWPRWYVEENKDLSPEELLRQRFVYTRVFMLKNEADHKKFQHKDYLYYAMTSGRYGFDGWQGHVFSYDDGDSGPAEHSQERDDAITLLKRLVNFERRMIERGNIPLEGSTNNLHEFAATLGHAIDKTNEVIKIDANDLLNRPVELPRSATQAFYVAAGTKAPTSSWEWFYERYIDSMGQRFPEQVGALCASASYPDVVVHSKTKKLIDMCQKMGIAKYDITEMKMREHSSYNPAELLAGGRALFTYAYDMTILVAILRAGARIIDSQEDFDRYSRVNTDKIALLRHARDAAYQIMEKNLGMQAGEREAIVDVMLRGKDPRDGITPLETLFAAYPPPPIKWKGPNIIKM